MKNNHLLLTALVALGVTFLTPATVHSAATLYVTNADIDTIDTVNSTGTRSPFGSSGGTHPNFMAFDTAGNLYVANSNNTIVKFTITAGVLSNVGTTFASGGLLSNPYGLAFDTAGNLYAANLTNNTIARFTPEGVGSIFPSSGLSLPTGLAFDGAGNLYVANAAGTTIRKLPPAGGAGSVFNTVGLNNPTGLAFDSVGNLYATSNSTGTIVKYNSAGVGSTFATGLSTPRALAFDEEGNLYAANVTNTITKYTATDGVLSNVGTDFATGFSNPAGLAFGVPEPTTFGLLLGSSLYLAARRRRSA